MNNIKCYKWLSFLYFIYKTNFQIKDDNNFLYYHSCLYKRVNFGDIIYNLNIYNIIKKHLLNYFIILKY